MSDEYSPRLSLPFLTAGQAQKEVSVNEALQRIDMLVQPVAQSADLVTPPESPDRGDCWIVPVGATGPWTGQDRAMAQWTAGGWRFSAPSDGWRCMVQDRNGSMVFRAGLWQDDAVRSDGFYLDGVKLVGSRMADIEAPAGGTIVDSEARVIINKLLVALRGHGLIGS